jgi:hypothetical protein
VVFHHVFHFLSLDRVFVMIVGVQKEFNYVVGHDLLKVDCVLRSRGYYFGLRSGVFVGFKLKEIYELLLLHQV